MQPQKLSSFDFTRLRDVEALALEGGEKVLEIGTGSGSGGRNNCTPLLYKTAELQGLPDTYPFGL
jgi:hypothetical protein